MSAQNNNDNECWKSKARRDAFIMIKLKSQVYVRTVGIIYHKDAPDLPQKHTIVTDNDT